MLLQEMIGVNIEQACCICLMFNLTPYLTQLHTFQM